MKRESKVTPKSPATRVRAREGRKPLDAGKALAAAAAGKSTAAIARAAGSKAKNRHDLSQIGRRILARIRERGQICEVFDQLDYDLNTFAQQVIDQATNACRVERHYYKNELVGEHSNIDWGARTAARSQYLAATGLLSLPYEQPGAQDVDLLADFTDEEIAEFLDLPARAEAARAG